MTELTPRDIQARIRAGATPAELAQSEGLDPGRVERFAAPVLAEREHIAALALASSVRRRGETSGHRLLRAAVAERLLRRGLDADAVGWDAYRMADGRWAVTGAWTADEVSSTAGYLFDPRARFSVAADEEGRRLIGDDQPRPTRRTAEDDEPTVDLTDELALVRVVQQPAGAGPVAVEALDEGADEALDDAGDEGPDEQADGEDEPGLVAETELEVVAVTVERTEVVAVAVPVDDVSVGDAPVDDEPTDDGPAEAEEPAAGASELGTLYAMLGSDGYSEDSPRVYAGLSDASAVPETRGGGWEPPVVVDVPVEPSPAEEAQLAPGEAPDRTRVPMDDLASVELTTPVDRGEPAPGALPGTDEPAPPYGRTDEAARAEEAVQAGAEQAASAAAEDEAAAAEEGAFQLESDPPPPRRPKRRRASVPSWDEIMFGGPKPQ